jgi:hypothetical protein
MIREWWLTESLHWPAPPISAPPFAAAASSESPLNGFIARSADHAGLLPGEPALDPDLGRCLDWIDPRLPHLTVQFTEDLPTTIARLRGVRLTSGDALDDLAARAVPTPLIRVETVRQGGSILPVLVGETPIADMDDTAPIPLLRQALLLARSRLARATRQYATPEDVSAAFGAAVPSPEDADAFDRAVAALVAPGLPEGIDAETAGSLEVWAQAGIGAPFIPQSFAGSLRQLGPWSWGAGDDPGDPMDAHMLRPEIDRFITGDWRPRFHVCHARHDANSGTINYVLVTDRLALIAQTEWGGNAMNRDRSATDVLDIAADLAELVAFTESIRDWPDKRLMVVHSDSRPYHELRWVNRPGERFRSTGSIREARQLLHRMLLQDLGGP